MIDLVSILYELEYFDKALELFGEKDDYRSAELMTLKGYNEYALDKY